MPFLNTLANIGAGLAGGIGAVAGLNPKKTIESLKGPNYSVGLGDISENDINQLSLSDADIEQILKVIGVSSGTQLAQRQNFTNALAAREGLGGQAAAALSRGAAIDAQEAIANQGANLQLQQKLSRDDAIRFLLQLKQGNNALSQQRDSNFLNSISQLASLAPSFLSGGAV